MMSLFKIFDIMVYDFIIFPLTLSHGLNPGLGNAGHVSFPSAVTAAPTQVLLLSFLLSLLLLLLLLQAARMANYTRFSPSDWSASNIDHYNSADASRSVSILIIIASVHYIHNFFLFPFCTLFIDMRQEPVREGEK